MKLTITRLMTFSEQDRLDLAKIWPSSGPASLVVDEFHRLYAARFNDRLLAAVRVELYGSLGTLSVLNVREVTRRRGVGQYLIEEVIRDNPQIRTWRQIDRGIEDHHVMTAFMQALGFSPRPGGWEKQLS